MAKFFLTILAILGGFVAGCILIALAYYGLELRGFYLFIVWITVAGLAVLPAILYSTEDL